MLNACMQIQASIHAPCRLLHRLAALNCDGGRVVVLQDSS